MSQRSGRGGRHAIDELLCWRWCRASGCDCSVAPARVLRARQTRGMVRCPNIHHVVLAPSTVASRRPAAYHISQGHGDSVQCMCADHHPELDCAAIDICWVSPGGRPRLGGRRLMDLWHGEAKTPRNQSWGNALWLQVGLPPWFLYFTAPCYCHLENTAGTPPRPTTSVR